jgi:ATP-dependent RNA helicase DeaD
MTQTDAEIFDSQTAFKDLGLRNSVLRGLADADYSQPTHIQSKLIPPILAGRDVIGQAKTGTGKTAAFGVPILHLADKDVRMQALVLTPTRELAAQVASELEELGKHTPIRTACIIGGESSRQQVKDVARGGHIIVGTPGRVMDLHGRKQISFDHIRFVVLDEVDRMLDIGFRDDIKRILKTIRHDHQTVFVSATISDEIEALARQFLHKDAEKITTAAGALTVSLVEQKYLAVEPWDKLQLLLHLLRHEQLGTSLVFCRTKHTVRRVTQYLRDKGVEAREIHGDLQQRKRTRVMNQMRKGSIDVVIASDLAARGLDVEHISHVINYDLPEDPEVYVHRIGRTGRAGRAGVAVSLCDRDEQKLLRAIERLTGLTLGRKPAQGAARTSARDAAGPARDANGDEGARPARGARPPRRRNQAAPSGRTGRRQRPSAAA